jgi:hypothetical protein
MLMRPQKRVGVYNLENYFRASLVNIGRENLVNNEARPVNHKTSSVASLKPACMSEPPSPWLGHFQPDAQRKKIGLPGSLALF